MSQEISWTIQGKLANGSLVDLVNSANYLFDQNVQGMFQSVVSVGTSEQDITLTVTTLGWAMLLNLDATHFVTYGPKSGGSMVALGKLGPGEFAVLRLSPGITLRAKADTAACLTQFRCWND